MKKILSLLKSVPVADNAKWSKWSITNFVLWFMAALGSFLGMNEYSGPTNLITQIIFYILITIFILWIWRLTINAKKKGAELSKWSLIFFVAFFIAQMSFTYLIKDEPENIYKFGMENSFKIVSEPIYKNKNLYILDSYEELLSSSSTNGMSQIFNSVGNFKKCIIVEDEENPITAKIGFVKLRNSFSLTKTGHYSAKCIADRGFVFLTIDLKMDEYGWKVERINYSSSDPDTQQKMLENNKKLGIDEK